MLPEYDFKNMPGGARGKYYKAYRAGHTVKIHKEDGSTVIKHFTLEDGAVMVEPDVRKYFPDSETVNRALRCLIPLLSKRNSSKSPSRWMPSTRLRPARNPFATDIPVLCICGGLAVHWQMYIILEGEGEVRVNGKHVVALSGKAIVGEIEFLDT